MTKLAIFALTFVAIVAFAEVSAYRTTITTTTIEDDDVVFNTQGSSEQCRRQIQEQQLNHCQLHITQRSTPPFDDEVLEMPVANPRQPQQQSQHLQQCCQQLRNVDQQCQCEAIQQVFDQAQRRQGGRRQGQQGSRQGQPQMQQVLRKAQMLPNECNLQTQQCSIRTPWM